MRQGFPDNETNGGTPENNKLLVIIEEYICLKHEYIEQLCYFVSKHSIICVSDQHMPDNEICHSQEILLTLSNFLGDCDLAFDAFLHSMGTLYLEKDEDKF